MASPMRLDSSLVEAAEREAALQKRSVPKQIEFWAELGKAVENFIGYDDVIAISQGLKRIELSTTTSRSVRPDNVFGKLETKRADGSLSHEVTKAPVYYESSLTKPGFLDRVNSNTGKRDAGHFKNGEFRVAE